MPSLGGVLLLGAELRHGIKPRKIVQSIALGHVAPRNQAMPEKVAHPFAGGFHVSPSDSHRGRHVLRCPRCGGRMRVLGTITQPDTIRRILWCLGLRAEPLVRAPARDPTWQQMDFDAA